MASLQQRLERGEVIILDGAMGTELERRGVPMHGVAWSAAALLTHPDVVRQVHEDYIRVGADIITTNTFSTARHVLEPAGMGDQVQEMNNRAVQLAQEARESVAGDRPVAIAGSISSMVARADRSQTPSAEQAQASYPEQAKVLAEAGVDLILLEMMQDTQQAAYAIQAAVATGLPVWVGFSCKMSDDGSRVLLLGGPPEETFTQALDTLLALGGAAVCVMHTEVEDTTPALQVIQQRRQGPVGAYAHSGGWQMPNWQFVNLISAEEYLAKAQRWVQTGVQIVGTCCGMGPDYIRLLKEQLPSHVPGAASPREPL